MAANKRYQGTTRRWHKTPGRKEWKAEWRRLLADAEKQRQELEKPPVQTANSWIDHQACVQCGRSYRGHPNQTRCRLRDCLTHRESPEMAQKRLKDAELEKLIAEQEVELEMDRFGRTRDKRKHRGKSINGSVSLDEAFRNTPWNLHTVTAPDIGRLHHAIPDHLMGWVDPTYESALPEIETYTTLREVGFLSSPPSGCRCWLCHKVGAAKFGPVECDDHEWAILKGDKLKYCVHCRIERLKAEPVAARQKSNKKIRMMGVRWNDRKRV